jgi:hypothetical protein
MHAWEIYAREIYACEMHAYEICLGDTRYIFQACISQACISWAYILQACISQAGMVVNVEFDFQNFNFDFGILDCGVLSLVHIIVCRTLSIFLLHISVRPIIPTSLISRPARRNT